MSVDLRKKFLSYQGLKYYDAKIKEVIDNLPDPPEVDQTLKIDGAAADAAAVGSAIDQLADTVATDYNESIIGLSIDGQVITYIKGDGTVHTIVTQDTDTTYSLATDQQTGLTKLYATTGSAEDGTMTQKAIKTELDKKVSVSVDPTIDMLVFTI